MEDLKLATGKDVKNLLWKHSYGEWSNGNLGEWANSFDEYPNYLAAVLLDHFIVFRREITMRKGAKRPL